MQFRQIIPALIFSAAIASCSSNEIGNSKDVSPETIYQQYDIKYAEGNAKAEVYSQFRFGGKNGTTLVLNNPSGVSFDGESIKVDSAGFSGAFYQVYKPASGFFGKHQLVFTDINSKKYSNGFEIGKIQLLNPPTTFSKAAPLVLQFDPTGLKNGDQIEVSSSNTDSSFSVSQTISAGNYSVTIPVSDLKKQKGNGFSLDIDITRDIPLEQQTKEGGRLTLSYKLKPISVKAESMVKK